MFILTVEIGSTTTKVRAFKKEGFDIKYLDIGQSPTTVNSGDVMIGFENAKGILFKKLGYDFKPDLIFASSSAAGGLKMTVHGLTYDMTVRAAKEASLGAGAVLYHYTVGKLTESDINKLQDIKPNIILLCGGVDYGERKKVLEIARDLAALNIKVPFIYAGNCAIQEEIKKIFSNNNKEITITENVYPRVDELNVEPVRREIQRVFSKHILHAPGMEQLSKIIDGEILPVPKSVMKGLEFFSNEFWDVLAIDIGGATTDIHSITEGTNKYTQLMISPEPFMKRTVEGDLGVFVNAKNILKKSNDLFIEENFKYLSPMPVSKNEILLTKRLTYYCLKWGLDRHAGDIIDIFTPAGKKQVVRGKDLTAIKLVIATGGALTQLDFGKELVESILIGEPIKKLLPLKSSKVVIDRDYLLGTIGLLYYNGIKVDSLINCFL